MYRVMYRVFANWDSIRWGPFVRENGIFNSMLKCKNILFRTFRL